MPRRFDQVANLVEGFETPFGLELLATVHWVIASMAAKSTKETTGVIPLHLIDVLVERPQPDSVAPIY